MTERVGDAEGRALWRRVSFAPGPPRVAPSEAELAAWLEGRLPEADAARVEAAMAADPALLDGMLAASAALRTAPPPAPERLAVRARALVAPEIAAGPSPIRLGAVGGWFAGMRRSVEWAAVAAAFFAVAVGGFSLGGGTQEAMARNRGETHSVLGVFDTLSSDAALTLFGDE